MANGVRCEKRLANGKALGQLIQGCLQSSNTTYSADPVPFS